MSVDGGAPCSRGARQICPDATKKLDVVDDLLDSGRFSNTEAEPTASVGGGVSETRNVDTRLCVPIQFSSVQLLSRVWLFLTQWTVACQASLYFTNSQSLLKFMSIELVTPSNHLILCHPLLLLPSIFLSIRVFSTKSVLCIKWANYWSFSISISLSNEYSGLISWTGLISLQLKGLSRVFSNTAVQKHQFFSTQLSLWSNSHIHTWLLENS